MKFFYNDIKLQNLKNKTLNSVFRRSIFYIHCITDVYFERRTIQILYYLYLFLLRLFES